MKKIITLGSLLSFFTFFAYGEAATPKNFIPFNQSSSAVSTSTPKGTAPALLSVAVADVSLSDLTVLDTGASLNGTFSLTSKKGAQANVLYGISIYDKKHKLLSLKSLGKESLLLQGEVKRYAFSYTLPASLQGEVTIVLEAYTEGGLPLGSQLLATKKLNIGKESFTCITEKNETLCTVKKDAVLTTSIISSSPFRESFASSNMEVRPGETFSLSKWTKDLSPGKYYLILSVGDSESYAFVYRAPGTFATIQNISISAVAQDTKTARVTGYVSGLLSGGFLTVDFLDKNGLKLSGDSYTLSARAFSFDTKLSTAEGTATVKLYKDKTRKELLATFSAPYSVITHRTVTPKNSVQAAPVATQKTSSLTLTLMFIFFATIILLITIKKGLWKKKHLFAFALLSLGVLVAPHAKVSALTIVDTETVPVCMVDTGDCDPPFYRYADCVATVSTDKSSYVAGDTMTLTGSVTSDRYDTFTEMRDCRLSYATTFSNPFLPSFDINNVLWWNPTSRWVPYGNEFNTYQTLQGVIVSGSGAGETFSNSSSTSFIIPSLSTGVHSLRITNFHQNSGYVGGFLGYSFGTDFLTFNAVNSVTPSVKLFFGN